MKRLVMVVASVLSLLGWCSAGLAVSSLEPEILHSYAYYHLNGASVDALYSQIRNAGPLGSDGRTYGGFTSWYVTWSYPLVRDAQGCTTGPTKVTLTLMTQLPRWNRPASASADLASRWNGYIAGLELHENGHAEIAVETARRVANTLPSIPPQRSCDALRSVAEGEGQRLLAQTRERNAQYDRLTNHGITQGARLR